MNCIFVAFICAVIGVLPLLIEIELIAAAICAVVFFLLGWPILYVTVPSAAYPLFGGPGVMVAVWISISAFVDASLNDSHRFERKMPYLSWVFPIIAIAAYVVTAIMYSSVLNAGSYSSMLGDVEERVWTQDIQPKNPKHMLMGSVENALYQADKALGQAGSIGSQFQVDRDAVTLQKIHDQWFYVVPLEYRGFSVYWSGADGIPAYIQVSAEDPNRHAQLIELKSKMKYAPSAYFNTNLKRYMRYNGYLASDLYEFLFEVDEDGNPWWVVPVFKPTIGWSGEKIIEVAQINPSTGEITHIAPDQIPAWMDRAFPGDLAQDYITWQGLYHAGWLNSWWGKSDLTVAKSPILIYGNDGEPYWVTGVTSDNGSDSSLVKLAYTDARMGKTVFYKVSGGLTEQAITGAVDSNEKIQFRQLHGVNPQLYNCYGTMASVVPLLNGSHIFQGVAIVDIMNAQRIAVGDNQEQALRQYQRLLEQNGQQIAIDNSRVVASMEGKVIRIGFDHGSGVYYLMIDQLPSHLLTLDATEHPELPLTQPGDDVCLTFENSGERVMPAVSFQNKSVPLEGTAAELAVKEQADQNRQKEQVRNAAPTVQQDLKKRLETMTPEELQALQQQIGAKQ